MNNYDYTQLPMPPTIKPYSTWNILDSSKLNSTSCWRKYFFQYILGWVPEGENKHFVFGTAWHIAMQQIALGGYDSSNLDLAYLKFLEYYRRYYDELTDLDNAPKNPANARVALEEYAQTWAQHDSQYKTLHTEVFVKVPINDEGRMMCGRMDRISLHPERGIVGIDHKTGSRRSEAWEQSWKLSFQMSFYYHVLNVAFPGDLDNIWGMLVDGVFFYKNIQKGETRKNIPVRVPIRKGPEMHQAFLSDINFIIEMLDWNMEGLSKTKPDDLVMSTFPRNATQCMSYGSLCPYHSICSSWSNPVKHCEEIPLGFQIKHWNPETDEDKPKPAELFNLEEGFKKGEQK